VFLKAKLFNRASRVAAICNVSHPIRHLSGDKTGKHRVGVVTSFESKESMRFALQQLLRAEKVLFLSKFISSTAGAKEEVCGQLKSYRFVDRGTENDLLTKRRGLSGKGTGRNDDLCIAIQMLAFWPSFYFDNPNRARVV
jgi:hypothetical protein